MTVDILTFPIDYLIKIHPEHFVAFAIKPAYASSALSVEITTSDYELRDAWIARVIEDGAGDPDTTPIWIDSEDEAASLKTEAETSFPRDPRSAFLWLRARGEAIKQQHVGDRSRWS